MSRANISTDNALGIRRTSYPRTLRGLPVDRGPSELPPRAANNGWNLTRTRGLGRIIVPHNIPDVSGPVLIEGPPVSNVPLTATLPPGTILPPLIMTSQIFSSVAPQPSVDAGPIPAGPFAPTPAVIISSGGAAAPPIRSAPLTVQQQQTPTPIVQAPGAVSPTDSYILIQSGGPVNTSSLTAGSPDAAAALAATPSLADSVTAWLQNQTIYPGVANWWFLAGAIGAYFYFSKKGR